ncbi:MAG: hypothetical protein ACYDCL_15295 [Myxococcales bacterium]
MNAMAAVRGILWAVLVGGLSAFLAAPVAVHAMGPLLVAVMRAQNPALWNPVIGGLSLAVAGALVVLAVGRVVVLSPALAAAGVATGALWMALLTVLGQGLGALWASLGGLLLRLAMAALAAAVGYRVAAMAGRRAAVTPPAIAPPVAQPAAVSQPTPAEPPPPAASPEPPKA